MEELNLQIIGAKIKNVVYDCNGFSQGIGSEKDPGEIYQEEGPR